MGTSFWWYITFPPTSRSFHSIVVVVAFECPCGYQGKDQGLPLLMLTLVLEEAPLDCCQLDGRVQLVGMDCRHQETVPVVVNLEVSHWRHFSLLV